MNIMDKFVISANKTANIFKNKFYLTEQCRLVMKPQEFLTLIAIVPNIFPTQSPYLRH